MILTNKGELVEIGKSETALVAATMFKVLKEGVGQKAGLQSWLSGEQTLASSGTCLEESHGI